MFGNVILVQVAVTILSLAAQSSAFWRMECRGSSGYARIDPLINFGVPAEHMHSVFGSSGFSETCGYPELRGGQCTSCIVTQDKSAYWHPSLYFQSTDGTYTKVPEVGGMLAYYNLNPSPGENITAFAAGFQMIAGDNYQRNFTLPVPDPPESSWASDPAQVSQQGLSAKAVGFNCLNYAIPPEGSLFRHFLPDKAYLDANCTDGIRAELSFPSCWNPSMGPTSANHKDHVAYPDLVLHGKCPSSHPVRLPGLFYEVIYDTYSFKGEQGTFVFANGDPTGYGYHGDFMMGWDEATLQSAVDTCTNESGLVQDCPVFTLQSLDEMQSCSFSMPDNLKSEASQATATGGISALPGNVQIKPGPAYAKGALPAASSPPPAAPPTTPTPAAAIVTPSAPPSPQSPTDAPAVAAAVVDTSTTLATSTSSTSMTSSTIPPPPPQTTPIPMYIPLKENQHIVTTTYSNMGNGVELELVVVEEDVYVTVSMTTTVASLKPRHAGRHAHKHGRDHHHGAARGI